MQRIYRVGSLVGFATVILLVSAMFAAPAFAAIPRTEIVKRLCDRQKSLGARLQIQLVDPALCGDTPPAPAPSLTFTADPASIDEGGSSLLTWDSANATTCEASDGWTGAKTVDGSLSVSPTVTTTYTLTCSGNGNITKSATVTVVDVPNPPTLMLVKTVTNNNGGLASANDFQAKIDGANFSWGVAHTVTTGAHTVSEVEVFGYDAGDWGGDCALDGTITLAEGEDKTCTITNDDQAGMLIVKKVVVNDNGGTATTSDFSFGVNGLATTTFEVDGQNDMPVNLGTYTVIEVADAGYLTTYDNCTDVLVSLGETETCTVTNNDIAVVPAPGHLIVDKVTQPAADTTEFTISATGTGVITGGAGGIVTDATSKTYEVEAGTYAVTETVPAGWTQVSNTCVGVIVAAGATETCTITNAKMPTLLFSANPTTVHEGSASDATTTLTWDSTNATSCVASNVAGWTGAKAIDDSEVVTPTTTSAYQLDCAGPGGSVQATTTVTFVPEVPTEGALLITEVFYDPLAPQVETDHEWVEIHNGTNSSINLSGYFIQDNNGFDYIPADTVLPAGAFLFISASSTTEGLWSVPAEAMKLVLADGDLGGSGLANGGDRMQLFTAASTTVDMVSWGDDIAAFDPSVFPTTSDDNAGSSIARIPITTDTDTAADWAEDATPTPGL